MGSESIQSRINLKQKKAPRGRRSALEGHVCYLVVLTIYSITWFQATDTELVPATAVPRYVT